MTENADGFLSATATEANAFLADLEKAKALSLETLELDRLRRQQKETRVESSCISQFKSTTSTTTTRSSIRSVKSKESSFKLSQRPLPPPPHSRVKTTTSSSSSDLIDFSTVTNNPSEGLTTTLVDTLGLGFFECPPPPPRPTKQTTTINGSNLQSPSCNWPTQLNFPKTEMQKSFPFFPTLAPLDGNPSLHFPITVTRGPTTPTTPPLSTPTPPLPNPATSILKFMEKKRNSNLIDLTMDDEFSIGSNVTTCAGGVISCDDLLRAFDPLLTKNEPKLVEPIPPLPVESSSALKFEDDFDPSKTLNDEKMKMVEEVEEEEEEEEKAPALPPRPRKMTSEFESVVDADTVVPLQFRTFNAHKPKIYVPSNKKWQSVEIVKRNKNPQSELEAFVNMVKKLRCEFIWEDYHTNVGLVISPTLESQREEAMSVKLLINCSQAKQPILFTCDVTTTVEHVISHVVCTVLDDSSDVIFDQYVLKVHGLAEYFSADSALVDYEYVHYCQKYDEDVRLTLIHTSELERPLARTAFDDQNDSEIELSDLLVDAEQNVTKEMLCILLETLLKEIDKMRQQTIRVRSVQPKGVIQAVKAICTILSQVETYELTDAIEALLRLAPPCKVSCGSSTYLMTEEEEDDGCGAFTTVLFASQPDDNVELRAERLEGCIERLLEAISHFLHNYCRAFHFDFDVAQYPSPPTEVRDISSLGNETLLVHMDAVHRVHPQWSTSYSRFEVVCELYHGVQLIGSEVKTKPVAMSVSFYEQIRFDEWLEFDIMMCMLARESRLIFTLYGLRVVQSDSKTPEALQTVRTVLGWTAIQLFHFNGMLQQGSLICGLWPDDVDRLLGPVIQNTNTNCSVIQINLPDFGCQIIFPPVAITTPYRRKNFALLDPETQKRLLDVIHRPSWLGCNKEESDLLWEKRNFLYDLPQSLPRVLMAVRSWNWTALSDIYSMLQEWRPMTPVDALELLLPCFPDVEVRRVAISWVKELGSDELCDFLPQLVQALKHETWSESATAKFLLERSLTSIRVAHHLYWLLKQNATNAYLGLRVSLMMKALLTIVGDAMRSRFEGQEELMNRLGEVADKIKTTKDSLRLPILLHEMEGVHYGLEGNETSLPLSPSLEVMGVEVKSCSYFTSNTLPLKICFRTSEIGAKPFDAIFKVGDDLRQDMLTLQFIRIMDKLWLKEGLNLRIVTFGCIATDVNKGIVEMVTGSETLRKIQTEQGLTGSFKDRPIAEWLQKHNPSELEFQVAVENFAFSCAGYSVATYILGICDRHNDNIMLKTTGHIFHIDFGKFLGDVQMFGNIKRDRVPFVLTSDMAYVINGGDKPSSRFQQFVELCCQAFNIIRKHANLFLHLFELMSSAGIPGVTSEAVAYVQKALLPGVSDIEAAATFSRMIEESLKSWFTQFNFFIHNLAQLRFSGDHDDTTLLSFIPKTYTMETDGKLTKVEISGCQKRYEPEKYYLYILMVEREGQPSPTFLFRSYREFWEFYQKLNLQFPLAKCHALPRSMYFGRSNVRQVAEKRKSEIELFLHSLWTMADEIRHCDLVYTFFHPLLRDQQDTNHHLQKFKEPKPWCPPNNHMVQGQVKMSIRYRGNTLFIMVMHARNLNSAKNTGPDPYVKTYLMPDQNKVTKRKTKVLRRNNHPTFMEMLQYQFPLEVVRQRILQVSVWDYDRMVENTFLGAVNIHLADFDLTKETIAWYSLGTWAN